MQSGTSRRGLRINFDSDWIAQWSMRICWGNEHSSWHQYSKLFTCLSLVFFCFSSIIRSCHPLPSHDVTTFPRIYHQHMSTAQHNANLRFQKRLNHSQTAANELFSTFSCVDAHCANKCKMMISPHFRLPQNFLSKSQSWECIFISFFTRFRFQRKHWKLSNFPSFQGFIYETAVTFFSHHRGIATLAMPQQQKTFKQEKGNNCICWFLLATIHQIICSARN